MLGTQNLKKENNFVFTALNYLSFLTQKKGQETFPMSNSVGLSAAYILQVEMTCHRQESALGQGLVPKPVQVIWHQISIGLQ